MCENAKQKMTLADKSFYVDEPIAEAVKALNNAGYSTTASCSGATQTEEPFTVGYVRFKGAAPDSLEQAARCAGFFLTKASDTAIGPDLTVTQADSTKPLSQVSNRRIAAADPFLWSKHRNDYTPEAFLRANRAFRIMLGDYAAGNLDLTGNRYKNELSFKYSFEMR